MDLISEEKSSSSTAPLLTIKRGAKMQWQEYVDRDPMGTFRGRPSIGGQEGNCQTLGGAGFRPKRSGSIGPQGRQASVGGRGPPPPSLQLNSSGNSSSSTLPRNLKNRHRPDQGKPAGGDQIAMELESLRLPRTGLEELEQMYAHMKNLSAPLPNTAVSTTSPTTPLLSMPPESSAGLWPQPGSRLVPPAPRDEDQESEICSVIAEVPPPPAQVKSHALLYHDRLPPPSFTSSSAASQQPHPPPSLTGLRAQKLSQLESAATAWGKTPPLPPGRTSSKLSLTRRSKDSGIYANASGMGPGASVNRTSLMSTGSSGESSGSSPCSVEMAMTASTTLSPTSPPGGVSGGSDDSGEVFFNWPKVWSGSPSPCSSTNDEANLRSVSQLGHGDSQRGPSSVAGSDTRQSSSSNVYAKMNNPAKVHREGGLSKDESDYISVLYSAVQRKSGQSSAGGVVSRGSVETAVSPYLRLMKSENEKCQRRLSDLMNVKQVPSASIDSISAIYAKPENVSANNSTVKTSSRPTSRMSTKSMKKSQEFKDLLREVEEKRLYRVGLNLFNSKPELGIEYLVQKDFLELSPPAVARFLHERSSGLAKEKVGEYLGNLQSPFAMKVLACFLQHFDFSGLRIDKALRRLLAHVRVPGEAQKIERIMEVFGKRFSKCNPNFAAKLKSPDSIVTLSFAVMLLNTDLHTPNLKDEKKMKVSDFVHNLEGVDGGGNFDPKLLKSIYKSIKKHEFEGGEDHVAQTQMIQASLVLAGSVSSGSGSGSSSSNSGSGQKKSIPIQLTEPHRRLVCLCRLYEVLDINATKKPSSGPSDGHQRDIFLFNDLLMVTKQVEGVRKGSGGASLPTYSYRDSFNLKGLEVTLFHTPVFDFGIQIVRKSTGCVLLTLNAGSEHDRYKFVMDLQESIFEMNQMEQAIQEISAS